jgi:hypothetical protein
MKQEIGKQGGWASARAALQRRLRALRRSTSGAKAPRGLKPTLLFALSLFLSAAVVDRVAVVIGKTVITESEVLQEIRLTAFQTGRPLDFSPAARRAAAERLVDQQLIRKEMEIGHYPQPTPAEVEAMYRQFRNEHHSTDAQYGITEDELKQHLQWELAAMRFTDQRFRVNLPATEQQGANRDAPGADSTSVDHQMDAWLKEARSQIKIQFKKEAFQ